MEHLIKTWEPFYTDILEGRKTFEFRKNDRGYKVGDILLLWRWPQAGPIPETFPVQVVYLVENAPHFGLPDGYCVMGIEKFAPPAAPSANPPEKDTSLALPDAAEKVKEDKDAPVE